VPLGAGGGVPVGSVGHDGGEHGLAFGVDVVQGLVAGGQVLLLAGLLVLAVALGGLGLGGGAYGGQAGVLGGGADLAEFVADVLRRPGGFYGVGVAQVQQRPVGHAAHVGAVGGAERGQGLVPAFSGIPGHHSPCAEDRPARQPGDDDADGLGGRLGQQ
jgi:hypothetical protein